MLQQKDSSQAELQYCPTFQPLLTTSLNIPESRPLLSELVKQIDDKSCLKLCIHLQSHLEDCSGAAKFDQIPLISKVKVSFVFLFHIKEEYLVIQSKASLREGSTV